MADGVPTGHPVVPVVKVTGNAATAEAMPADIDVDATNPGDWLVDVTRGVLDGAVTATEVHGLTAFAISRAGPRCRGFSRWIVWLSANSMCSRVAHRVSRVTRTDGRDETK
jgi:hypothetical protein